ncbi:MAG: hypothetical protein NTV03_04085 [Candidatus Nomurabacteria bacterium]|nr:hypothetical protein [Candidatus Nomurabacteria bacterium]
MNSETKNCQNCKKDFIIEPDDFSFYKKMNVPSPTFCPECRLQRRLTWRNERNLYRRKCDVPGHNEFIIAMYPENTPFPVYDTKYLWSDEWDANDYKMDLDFSRPFFEQWKELFNSVPTISLINLQDVNSDYCNFTYQSKNCYLNFASDVNEDTAYLYHSIENRNCYDMLGSRKNENCYELIDCEECYNSAYLKVSSNCIDSRFCYDCRNCSNCIGCVGLRNAQNCILNVKYSPIEYKSKLEKLNLSTILGKKDMGKEYGSILKNYPRKFSNSRHSVKSTGDYINGAKNCTDCFDIEGPAQDLRYVIYGVTNMSDTYDCYAIGMNIENSYECFDSGDSMSNVAFTANAWNSFSCRYCYFIKNCSNCFGCVGIKNKQYCILNKQYTKEEYEDLLLKIIEHMNDKPYIDKNDIVYKYGEFFPSELSPFAYNESIVSELFPNTKEEILNHGYRWKDKEVKNYKIDIRLDDLPIQIKDIDDLIIGKVIECSHYGKCSENCTLGFKIIPEELQFYKKMNLPLPHLCPNCRHYERLSQRNPMKLWHRSCMKEGCTNEFETSYAPDRPEIIYCEKCYQQEVY